MSKYEWRFPILDDGTTQGFNDGGIATFKGSDLYNNLAREICQNSLDAKADGKKTVTIKFDVIKVPKNDYNAIFEFDEIIKACKDYWGMEDTKFAAFIKEAETLLSQDTIDFLVISDFNTKGLTGAKDLTAKKTVWKALTNSNGVTNKSSGGSGGSYGIGKSAPFACSALRTVFYNTYAIDEVKAFQGVSRLVTHYNSDGVETQGDGYYKNIEDRKPIYDYADNGVTKLFPRNEYGTDVIVAGFKTEEDWQDIMIKAIIKNFFVAIHEETLEVYIGDKEINDRTLPNWLTKFAEEEAEDADSEKSIGTIKEFYETLVSLEHQVFKTSILEENDLWLYLKKGEDYSKKIAEMRAIGMLVRSRGRNIITRFSALVIARGVKLNEKLKNMEPPKHDEWDPDILEDVKDKKEAKEIRGKIVSWTNKCIVEECKTEYQDTIDPDGISQFLPLELEDTQQKGASKDSIIPDGETAISNIKKRNLKMKSTVSPSVNTYGTSNGGAGSNKTTGGTTHNPGGERDPNGTEKVHVEKNKGKNKVENSPKVLYQRSYPITPNYEIYKTIIVLEEDNDKVHISAKAIGDDGKSESLKIKEYTIDSIRKQVVGSSIGPLSLKAGIKYNIYMKLEIKERLLINIIVN